MWLSTGGRWQVAGGRWQVAGTAADNPWCSIAILFWDRLASQLNPPIFCLPNFLSDYSIIEKNHLLTIFLLFLPDGMMDRIPQI